MSHSYPLAKSAKDAIAPGCKAARTRAEAESFAPDHKIDSLQTDWLPMSAADVEALFNRKDDETANGFLQRYEDEKGNPVIAVTYWKLIEKPRQTAKKDRKSQTRAPRNAPESTQNPSNDHTDDLYFRRGRTKPRRKKVDPNQLDLFNAPKAED